MAILAFGGEDIDAVVSGGDISTTTAYRRADYCRSVYRLNTTTHYWDFTHSNTSDYHVTFRYATTSVGSTEQNLVQFGNANLSQHIAIRSNSTALTVKIWDGSAYVQLGTTNPITYTSSSNIYKMHIYIKLGASAVIKLWVNDVPVIDYSGNLTSYITEAFTLTRFRPGTGGGQVGAYSEVMISDQDIHTCSLVTLAPSGNGSDAEFTGSYTDIDEVTSSDADFIYSDATGSKRSNFALTNLPTGTDSVHGVLCSARVAKDTTGDAPSRFRFYTTLDSTRYYSDYFEPTEAWATYKYTWLKRPDNNAYWSRNDVDALTIGIETIE